MCKVHLVCTIQSLCSVHCALHSVQGTLYNACAVYTMQCLSSVQCTLCNACAVCSIHYAMCSVHYAMCRHGCRWLHTTHWASRCSCCCCRLQFVRRCKIQENGALSLCHLLERLPLLFQYTLQIACSQFRVKTDSLLSGDGESLMM